MRGRPDDLRPGRTDGRAAIDKRAPASPFWRFLDRKRSDRPAEVQSVAAAGSPANDALPLQASAPEAAPLPAPAPGPEETAKGYDRVLEALERETGTPTLVVFEASHPDTTGRPSNQVVEETLRLPFMSSRHARVCFPEDRIDISPHVQDLNIICIGGPRSNVVSRTILEYENVTGDHEVHYYSRITRPSYTPNLLYVQNPELIRETYVRRPLGDALKEVEARFPDPGVFRNLEAKAGGWTLRDPQRILVDFSSDPRTVYEPIEVADNEVENPKPEDKRAIVDHIWITMMPNPFGAVGRRAILVSGCTSLGTSSFLHREVVAEVERLLAQVQAGPAAGIFQSVIPVVNPDAMDEPEGGPDSRRPFAPRRRFGNIIRIEPKPVDVGSTDWEGFSNDLTAALRGAPTHIRRQVAELNRFDADQMLRALHLDPLRKDSPNIYVLGSYEETKTFATQQARALTFVHALHKSQRVKPDTRLVVVGAGISGLTTAVAAAMTGIRVLLVDRHGEEGFLSHLASGGHRFIHPTFYEWPLIEPDEEAPELPFFRWSGGTTPDVTREFLGQFHKARQDVRARYGEDRILIFPNREVVGIETESLEHRVYFKPPEDRPDAQDYVMGDIVVLATGFAREAEVRGVPDSGGAWRLSEKEGLPLVRCDDLAPFILSKGYWDDDKDAFERVQNQNLPAGQRKYVVVSGQGDAALIDILRLCIRKFDHGKLINKLCFGRRDGNIASPHDHKRLDLYRRMGQAMRRVTGSDEFNQAVRNRQREKLIEEALSGLPVRELFDLLEVELDPDVRIINVVRSGSPFVANSATAHRLLVWSLFMNRRIEFITGQVTGLKVERGVSACPNGSPALGVLSVEIERKVSQDGKSGQDVDKSLGARIDLTRRVGNVVGLVIRHGIDMGATVREVRTGEGRRSPEQRAKWFRTPAGLAAAEGEPDESASAGASGRKDGAAPNPHQLISMLNLTGRPHPETVKFFLYTIRRFR